MSAPFVIPSIFTAVDKFSAPVKAMGNAVQGFVGRSERLLNRANIAFSKLLTPLTSINRMLMGLGFYVGLFTLVRIMKNAVDIFADFQQANADLAVVMGVSVSENKILADEARRIGLAYGQSATEVVRMQHALATLGFEQDQIMKMGRPLITGSAALEGADPERLADVVGAVINTFDNLAAGDTQHILDVMALSANRTALNFEKLATTLPIVSGPANAVNISFEETVALLGVLSNAGVHVATSATSLKNIFIDSAKKGHTYSEVLANIAKHSDKLVYANKQFGKRSVVSALALTQKMHDAKNGVIALTGEFKNAQLGLTELIAIDRLNTFRGAQKLLNAAYSEFILAIEDGNGPLAQSLTRILKVASAMLLLSSDSDQAREAIQKIAPDILDTADKWLGWLKVIGWVTAALLAARAALWAWRGLLIITTALQGLWSIAMGVAAANGWLNVWAIRGNVVALQTFRIWAWLSTAAQNAFNLALNANPFFLITVGIIGLADAYGRLTSKIESSIEAHKRWAAENNREFAENKVGAGDKILNMLGLRDIDIGGYSAAKISGSDFDRQNKVDSIAKINPKAAFDSELMDSLVNQVFKGKIEMNINDPGGHVKDVKSDSTLVMPRVTETNTFQ